jgi:hypothetical protein
MCVLTEHVGINVNVYLTEYLKKRKLFIYFSVTFQQLTGGAVNTTKFLHHNNYLSADNQHRNIQNAK